MKRRPSPTKPCPHCNGTGNVPQGYKAESHAVARSFAYHQAEKDPAMIGAVYIPRAHSIDFGATAGVLCAGGAGLLGASLEQCAYAAMMGTAAVFTVVRWISTRQNNERVKRLDELAGGMVPQAAPQNGQPVEDGGGGYLPVHSAPPRTDQRHTALKNFVRGCEINTTQNYWESSRKMKRDKYIELRDLLIVLGWAGWNSENSTKSGWELWFPADFIIAGLFRGTTRDGQYAAPPRQMGKEA